MDLCDHDCHHLEPEQATKFLLHLLASFAYHLLVEYPGVLKANLWEYIGKFPYSVGARGSTVDQSDRFESTQLPHLALS